ncbi:MAG: Nif3-like dinuclear metal center hexameric protein [Planctomycetes bacterium]|nr:Nif3-like dinuclear metal center hexameric protein [Planctomycetota bacterium]
MNSCRACFDVEAARREYECNADNKEKLMSLLVSDVIEIFRKEIPQWDSGHTVDTLKTGSESDEVKGIVSTMVATRDVLAEALQLGANLVITHEPTFYGHEDYLFTDDDPVQAAKLKFINDNGLAVWRCHDAWHHLEPDGILAGMVDALGWGRFQSGDDAAIFDFPQMTLADLAAEVKSKLDVGMLRCVGNPAMVVRRAAFSVGCNSWENQRRLLRVPGVDVLLCGEQREWETCEYVRDSASVRPQGLIVLGHVNSEEAGMKYLADWLRPRVSGIPVHYVQAGDPFCYL